MATGSGSFRIDVPNFDNTTTGYTEFRKRAMLFKARLKLEKKENQAAIMLVGSLSGIAWDTCESLAEDTSKLEDDKAFDLLIDLLDSRFRHDKSTELPEAFEEYFFTANRKHKESLFEYISRIRLSTKRIQEHKIKLPDKVRGWLLLRRAGLSEEQKTLVMSQCGTDLAFDKVASLMQTTFGEKQMPSDKKHRPAAAVHYTDTWDDECWDHEEQHDDWSTADAYYGAEEEEDDWYDAYDDDVYYGDDGEDWYDPEGWT
jgi:hypothetical protein